MVHTLKILCILIKKQKYRTTRNKQDNQKLPMEWVGGKLEVRIPYSRKA